MKLIDILTYEEGFRAKPYLCSEGYVTIGLGTKLHKSKGMNPNDFLITVTPDQAAEWLTADIKYLTTNLSKSSVGNIFINLSQDRHAVVLSMAYQMGVVGILKFSKMWKAFKEGDFQEAANQALDSLWARQTSKRAHRHARVLAGETLEQVYRG